MSQYDPFEVKRTRVAQKMPPGNVRKKDKAEWHHETKGNITKEYTEVNDKSISDTGEFDTVKRNKLAKDKPLQVK